MKSSEEMNRLAVYSYLTRYSHGPGSGRLFTVLLADTKGTTINDLGGGGNKKNLGGSSPGKGVPAEK